MDSSLLIAAGICFAAGALGYIIARMWIKPIFLYNITKRRIEHELGRYLAATNVLDEPDTIQEEEPPHREILRCARQHAMTLVTCYSGDIPYWYRLLLESRGESPTEASGMLTNLSKIRDREQIQNRIDRVRIKLGLKLAVPSDRG